MSITKNYLKKMFQPIDTNKGVYQSVTSRVIVPFTHSQVNKVYKYKQLCKFRPYILMT